MKKNPLAFTIAILLVIIFGSWLFFCQVRKSTVVVITTFGKPTATHDIPGLYFRLPPPIQRAYTFDQRIQNFEDKLDEDLTSDHYSLLVMVYVGWQIKDAKAFFPTFADGSIPAAEDAMDGTGAQAKKEVIGRHPLADFVSTDPKQLKFEEIENEILAIIQKQVNDKNYGISMQYLGIKRLELPESVTQEVFKRMTVRPAAAGQLAFSLWASPKRPKSSPPRTARARRCWRRRMPRPHTLAARPSARR